MENFTPRVMRGWELDYPNATKLNPNIIMVSCSGYGPEGPYAQYPAQATTQEATHGLALCHRLSRRRAVQGRPVVRRFLATWALVMGTTLGAALPASLRQGAVGRCRDVPAWLHHGERSASSIGRPTSAWANGSATAIPGSRRRAAIAAPATISGASFRCATTKNGRRFAGRSGRPELARECALRQQRRAHGATMTRSTRSSARGAGT